MGQPRNLTSEITARSGSESGLEVAAPSLGGATARPPARRARGPAGEARPPRRRTPPPLPGPVAAPSRAPVAAAAMLAEGSKTKPPGDSRVASYGHDGAGAKCVGPRGRHLLGEHLQPPALSVQPPPWTLEGPFLLSRPPDRALTLEPGRGAFWISEAPRTPAGRGGAGPPPGWHLRWRRPRPRSPRGNLTGSGPRGGHPSP